jgi:hypothetical protein
MVAMVRDRSTGRIGSAAATVNVPNLSREEVALSSIRLSAGDASPADEFAETSSAARRRFRPGQPLNWECEVLTPAEGKRYQILVTLKRGESIVYRSEPIKSSSPIRGRVHLGNDLEPGQYRFELQVNGTTQAIDFETR